MWRLCVLWRARCARVLAVGGRRCSLRGGCVLQHPVQKLCTQSVQTCVRQIPALAYILHSSALGVRIMRGIIRCLCQYFDSAKTKSRVMDLDLERFQDSQEDCEDNESDSDASFSTGDCSTEDYSTDDDSETEGYYTASESNSDDEWPEECKIQDSSALPSIFKCPPSKDPTYYHWEGGQIEV